jgi:hypothetical protein
MTLQHDPHPDHRIGLESRLVDVPVSDLTDGLLSVVSCSQCLRVLRAGVWIEAEEAIRELRSFERPAPLSLEPALCDECSSQVQGRRVRLPLRPATSPRRRTAPAGWHRS